MEKMNGTSMNLVQENIKKLKEIFPEVFVEGNIDFDVLKEIFGGKIESSKERYSLNWNGKSKARQIAQEVSTGTLRPAKEESKNWDNTENIYIEGDNLEVLKLLQKSYHGKIKMIYIDPPYNTGKDFVYKDNFKDNLKNYLEVTGQVGEEGVKLTTNAETSGRYHSDWLSMMYPRLKLARNLLTDDGVIFISIDDNEQANLKKLCDEIFGEENFVGNFIINTAPNGRDYGHIAKQHEFCLFYSKNIDFTETNLLPDETKDFKYNDKKGGFNIHPLYNSNEKFHKENRPNLYYPFYINLDEKDENGFYKLSLEEKKEYIKVYPPKSKKNNVQFVWRWGKEKAQLNLNVEIVGYRTDIGEYRIIQKMRNDEKLNRSLISGKQFTSRKGTESTEKLMGGKHFDFPKPVDLIKNLAVVSTNSNSIILDFFSGSATTAHSVMQLNAEDGGNRKYVMVQLPELCKEDSEAYKAGYKNICEIGKERIRRAGDKIRTDESLPLENREKLDTGFKVFKLDSSNIKEWDTSTNDLQQSLLDSIDSIKLNRNSLDVLYEILLKYGLDLNIPIKETENFYSIGGGTLLVSLNNEIDLAVINSICEEYKKILEIDKEFKTTVILKDSSFKNDVDKTNALKKLEQVGISEIRSI